MRTARVLRVTTVVVAAVLVLVVGAAAFLLYTGPGRDYVRRLLVARLGDQVTGRLTIGRLSGDLPNEVVLHDVALVDSAGSPVFAANRIGARVNVLQLFSKRIDISSMTLEQPRLVLRHRRGGAWNVARVFAREDRDATDSRGRGFGHWVRIANAEVSDGEVIVRMPWPADSEVTRVARDSDSTVTARARARVERTDDGFEQVMEFRDIEAAFPRVLLAHPDTARIIAEVGRASMIAAPFQPPVADIRDLGGTLVVTSDSLQFVGWRVVLPGSRMTVQLLYAPTTGALRGQLRADPLAFRDLQWLYPLLPGDGHGSVTLNAVRDTSGPLELRATDLAAEVGASKAAGEVGFAVGDTVRLTDADVRIASMDTELVDRFLPGRIPLQGTVDARATVKSAEGGLATNAVVTFRDRRGATSRVEARGTITLGDAFGARELRVRLSPLDAGVVRAFVPRARVRGRLIGRATIAGTARRRWRVSGDLTHVDGGARSRAVGTAMVLPGEGRVEFDGHTLPLSLDAIARLAPDAGLHGSASGRVSAELNGDTLVFRTTLRVADGTLGGSGRVSWGADGVSYDVKLEPRELDPRAVSTRAPRGRLSGTVTARGRGTELRMARSEVSVALDEARVDRVSVDSIRLAARAANGIATVDTLAAWRGGGRVTATGTLGLVPDRVGSLAYHVRTDSLGSLLGLVGRPVGDVDGDTGTARLATTEISGRATLEGVARGNVDSLRLEGRASFDQVAIGERGARHARADYTLGVGRDDTLAIAVSAESARVGRLAYERAELDASGTRRRSAVTIRVRQTPEVRLAATGAVTIDSSAHGDAARGGSLDLEDAWVHLPSGDWRTRHPSTVTWRAGSLGVDSLVLEKGDSATVALAGRLAAAGDGAMGIRLVDLPLSDIATLRQSRDELHGRVTLEARVTGTPSAPRANGSASLTHIAVRDDSLPDARATLVYADARLTVAANVGDSAAATLARATAELPINLALTGVSGSRLARSAPVLVDVRVDSLPLAAMPPRGGIALDSGWVRGEVRVRGSVDEPVVAGQVDVVGGRAHVPAAGVTLRDISAAAHLATDSLVIDSLVARSNGPIRASGHLVRSPEGPGRVVASLTARDAEVLGGSQGILHADADLAISGTTDSVAVTGRAEVLHGFIERKGPGEQALHVAAMGDPELFANIDTSAIARRESGPDVVRRQRTVHADVAVRINPGVWYRSAPNARIEAYTPRDLRVRGDVLADEAAAGGVVLTRGGVYVFRLRPFEIVRGGATLAGASGVAPLIQATGEHDVWIFGRGLFPVRFISSGFPSDVQFSLGDATIRPAAPPDAGSYLSLGRPPVSLLQNETSSLSGLSTSGGRFTGDLGALVRRQQVSPALGAILYQLAKGARDAIGVRMFTVTPTDLPPELAESRFAGVRGTTMDAGYLFGSRTYLGARIRLSAVSPGVVLVHSFRDDLELRAAYEPLFRLGAPPTLGPPQDGALRRAFGAFLTKEWWF